jgi:hypothetical protein
MFLQSTSLFRIFCIFILIGILFCFSAFDVMAQSGAGVSISPALIEETVDPGQQNEYHVVVENLSDTDVEYFLFPLNIKGVKEGGIPIFAENNFEVTGYELADWIDIKTTQLTLPAGGTERVDFSIAVPDDASPGSHFGGVFVSVDPPEIRSSGAAIGYQVANIISLRVSGEAIEQATIRQFSTGKFLYGSQNIDFTVRIENSGNVLIRPTGPLEINNMLGKQVGTMVFNESKAGVFPKTTKTFENIVWEGDSVGFGRYEAILSPTFGDTGAINTISSTVTFWILPMNIIGPALAVLAVILLTIFIIVKVYIRRSLEQVNQGRRLVRRRKRGGSATLLVTVVMLTTIALFLIVLLALFA